uniref:BTB domain-containing protein n=2 Tax=Physcomitrium patens TaxID=3218 RepID=A0A7I3ZZK1_PHYPA|nr:BTB/POZ domain-containing protein At5g48800-like isoform X3 [Physcomitrium patens]|eukprot:XP_024385970.1 BTB/POZ domain-containing protein At5g48800-like isoform X3 [Physcomitrella patens]
MAKKVGLNGWLQRVRETGEHSDVVVRVTGEEFRLHMLPLRNESGYFRDLPSSSNGIEQVDEKTGCKLVNIHHLPGGVEGFAIAVNMCYLIKPSFTVKNVALVCAAAEFLAMEDVTESARKFMHSNIFSHWRYCVNYLQNYTRIGSPVDEYVEFRCQKVLATACVKCFTEIKHVSAPSAYISGPLTAVPPKQSSSACQTLTELLVQVCSLPDIYAAEIINTLVDSDVNLNLKCRQGRNVRRWLESVIDDECQSDKARCYVLLCLSRMLLKNAPTKRPWMELSSQYWCSLLEHADQLLPLLGDPLKERLIGVKAMLEEKIGESLNEMDEYLRDYKFGPDTLMSLVEYYISMGEYTEQSLEEIAGDVDRFLWFYANECSISVDAFISLVKAFPPSARDCHDTIYGAIEKLISTAPNCSAEEQQQLWSLIDHFKLSPSVNERALNNPVFLSQPEILESVLLHHSQELAKVDDTDGRHLRHIMQKVINASLKLLEENSRRSREILELQRQYGELLGCRSQMLNPEGIVDLLGKQHHSNLSQNSSLQRESETEESEISDSPSLATVSSTGATSNRSSSHMAMLPRRNVEPPYPYQTIS